MHFCQSQRCPTPFTRQVRAGIGASDLFAGLEGLGVRARLGDEGGGEGDEGGGEGRRDCWEESLEGLEEGVVHWD